MFRLDCAVSDTPGFVWLHCARRNGLSLCPIVVLTDINLSPNAMSSKSMGTPPTPAVLNTPQPLLQNRLRKNRQHRLPLILFNLPHPAQLLNSQLFRPLIHLASTTPRYDRAFSAVPELLASALLQPSLQFEVKVLDLR